MHVFLAGAWAAQVNVKSVEIVLPNREDVPVVRALMQTKAKAPYNGEAVAGDLFRLGGMGYGLKRFEARFDKDGAAISLDAAKTDKPSLPHLTSVKLVGGLADINETCQRDISQQASTLFRKHRLDYYSLFLWDIWGVEAQYRARGYLDARVAGVVIRVGADGAGRLEIRIEPGVRFGLGKVTVHGNRKLKAPDLIRALKLSAKAPWREMLRRQMIDGAARFCRERGYLAARVKAVPAKQPNGSVDVRVEIEEGDRYVLNGAVVRGAGKLKDKVAKLITLRKGEPVKYSEIEALRRSIEDLGAFSKIEMPFVPLRDRPAGHRDLVIELTKADLGRDVGAAEELFYETMKRLVRLYNRGDAGLRSIRIKGFASTGQKKISIDATIARPDYGRVRFVMTPRGPRQGRPPQEVSFLRKGRNAAVYFSQMGKSFRLPASCALALRLDAYPPDIPRDVPASVRLSAAVTSETARPNVVLLGARCPPVAVYFTKLANSFTREPPKLEPDGALSLAGDSENDGPTKIYLGADKLPRRVTRYDKDGNVTARFDIEINPTISKADQAFSPKDLDDKDRSTGPALMVPTLSALALPDVAARLADKAAAENPKSPACLAARGLMRLAGGAPEPGLADLRAAAKQSPHPAYALLLAETLLRGRRFAEARTVCQALLKAGTAAPEQLGAADVLLDAGISINAALDTLMRGAGDYRRRAVVDCALAHIGLGEYGAAAGLARKLLRGKADDPQAVELLARCELSLGKPKKALAALAKIPVARARPEADTYAALAHHMLGQDARAAGALARAMKKAPLARNLLLLQGQAAEIHARYKDVKAKAALAKVFSRAALGELAPEEKETLAAIVNDVRVARTDVDDLVKQAAVEIGPKDKRYPKVWAAARRRIIEDALICRWAAWKRVGAGTIHKELSRILRAEMTRLGARDIAQYSKMLEESGKSLEQRRNEVFRGLLKREAFLRVLSDKVLARPSEIRTYYEKNRSRLTLPRTARFRMITLHFVRFRDKDQALELGGALLRRLKAKPDTFEELAKQYSHDANASRGGLWANVTKGSLLGPLDKAVFAMKAGQPSKLIQTDRGCHIVRVEKMLPERIVPLDQAAGRIGRAMQQANARTHIAAWLLRLKSESYIKTFDK